MKVFTQTNGKIVKKNLLIDALNLDVNRKTIISFVGGGGKTSLIYKMGNELKELGKKVIITTTTKMFMPQNNVVLTEKEEDIINLLHSKNMITVGNVYNENHRQIHNKIDNVGYTEQKDNKDKLKKIKGVSDKLSSKFIEMADFVLVEADGSKRLPLKMPDEHEPVIFEKSNLVIGVCGIDAIGKTIIKTCHRANVVSKFLESDEKHIITAMDVAKILSSNKGQRKNVVCQYKVIINKSDNKNELEKAKSVSKYLCKYNINESIITSFKESNI